MRTHLHNGTVSHCQKLPKVNKELAERLMESKTVTVCVVAVRARTLEPLVCVCVFVCLLVFAWLGKL